MRASGQYTYGSTNAAEKKEKMAKKKDLVDSHLSEDINIVEQPSTKVG